MNDLSFSTAVLASQADDTWLLRTAHIVGPDPEGGAGRFCVRRGEANGKTVRAASCLVLPEPGDLVLIAEAETGESYILSILTRSAAIPCAVTAADGGAIAVTGTRVDLAATAGVTVSAPQLAVSADETTVSFRTATLIGKTVFGALDRIETAVQEAVSFAQRSVETIGTLVRRVQGQETTSARQVVQRVDETLTIQATHAAIVARDQMRIDGERITMG